MDGRSPEDVVAEAQEAWPSPLEEALFGTTEPQQIVRMLRGYTIERLDRALETLLFCRRGVGVVFGVRLADGTAAVVKVHRREIAGRNLDGIVRVQAYLADRGPSAPRPLAEPGEFGRGIATAEEMLSRTSVFDAHASEVRTAMAVGLHEFVEAAKPLLGSVQLDAAAPFGLEVHARWPIPHDLRFDLALAGGEWIDERADAARARLLEAPGDHVIGHLDWRAENLDVEDGGVVAIFDWDSVATLPEPALVGGTAAGFTADWSDQEHEPRPSRTESLRFLRDYESARGRAFTWTEREMAEAAYVYALSYSARCEHSDVSTGLFPDPGIDRGWRGLLRRSGDAPLLTV